MAILKASLATKMYYPKDVLNDRKKASALSAFLRAFIAFQNKSSIKLLILLKLLIKGMCSDYFENQGGGELH